jgi:hypothetical protein
VQVAARKIILRLFDLTDSFSIRMMPSADFIVRAGISGLDHDRFKMSSSRSCYLCFAA